MGPKALYCLVFLGRERPLRLHFPLILFLSVEDKEEGVTNESTAFPSRMKCMFEARRSAIVLESII